ncbi:hypothetical protein QLQ12_39560 [Actinoplanes sp. NEAU-A12]|uniref:Ankyrin repeat domain-containing protein n=1 Tax=Actinoplanes sandaracinus TaxID=3045177 RepID=A0ABT6WY99_9ACTN|nr:hypothetical protein [Actinoplanes sandaracinus]MDI6104707.1 hypothetical protein [Actinoplanes sandaracinus]
MTIGDRLSLPDRLRIRRYAVPARMIAECAEARERGDWRAACEAGRIDVAFAPQVAAEAEKLAAHLAPDLLRWHLPRALGGFTTLSNDERYLLVPDEPVAADGVLLTVWAPVSVLGSQRLTLTAARVGRVSSVAVPAYLWDARHAGGLRAALGGSAERLPLLTPAAGGLPAESLGAGDDLPARAERVRGAFSAAAAFSEAGVEIAAGQDDEWSKADRNRVLAAIDPLRLSHDARWLAARFRHATWLLWAGPYRYLKITVDGDAVRAGWSSGHPRDPAPEVPRLHADLTRFDADLELIRRGHLAPGALHPLVREALFPGVPPVVAEPYPPTGTELVRVRCRGDWHEIDVRLGRLDLRSHTPAEQQRERAMRAFGGEVSGCFAVEHAWYGAPGRLPRRLRAHREDLWQRMIHGGTRTVLDLLDAGMDPQVRDSGGGTLMHRLRSFDHRRLLPRLLAEGLDVDARDKEGGTPLYVTVVHRGPGALIIALVDAGADPYLPNQHHDTVIDHVDDLIKYRDDLEPDFEDAVAYLRKRA